MALLKDEEKQLLLDRYVDIEWPHDVDDLRCVRCTRVAIYHYMSNCRHLFCRNCRKVFSDGGRWKCPQCQHYVTQLDDQGLDVEFKFHKLKIFCPNKKYGCRYEDLLKKIPSHLMTCVDTREAALPMEYTGTNTTDAVVSHLVKVKEAIAELKDEMREMKDKVGQKFKSFEDKDNDVDRKLKELNERMSRVDSQVETINRRVEKNELLIQQIMDKLSRDVDEMKTKMAIMEKEKKEAHKDKKSEDLKPLATRTNLVNKQ